MNGLYIHVPFCARACPYCDFDFEVGRMPQTSLFMAGLQVEAEARGAGGSIQTLYVGGGTPTMLGPSGIRQLAAWVDVHFDRSQAQESTIEANPEHVDEATVAAMSEAGFDRVSIGMQTFEPTGLVQLGRVHNAAQGRHAVQRCLQAGLRVSLDLIVGWPGQTVAALRHDLDAIAASGIEHVSIYALTVEPGTPWVRLVQRGLRKEPEPAAQADALQLCEAVLTAAGFEHYEVASYARPGARARHNQRYWTWKDYVGLGPSAASATFDSDGTARRHTNRRGLSSWRSDPGAGQGETLAPRQAAVEGLWTGLRLLEGLDVTRYLDAFPAVDRAWLDERVARECSRGNLEWTDGGQRLRVSPQRWLFHDEICAGLM